MEFTWASAPDDTRTFKTLEKAKPVTLFWWPLSLLFTCRFKKVFKSSCYAHITYLYELWYPNPNLFQDLINANIIDLYWRVLHSDGNNVIILWMKSKKRCCRWRGHESCHCLQGIKCMLSLRFKTTTHTDTQAIQLSQTHWFINTLNVIMLNKEIFPPDADITYESFLESAKHGTASSGFVSLISFVIRIPLEGCHNWGGTAVDAWRDKLEKVIRKETLKIKVKGETDRLFTMEYMEREKTSSKKSQYLSCHVPLVPLPFPEFVYSIVCQSQNCTSRICIH